LSLSPSCHSSCRPEAGPCVQRPQGPTPEQIAASAAKIVPGFVGSTPVGKLGGSICAPKTAAENKPAQPSGAIPFTLDAAGTSNPNNPAAATDTAKPQAPPQSGTELKFGRCRSSLLVRSRTNPKSVALIAVFRLMDDSEDIALILHVPPVVKPGTKVLVALAEKQAIGLPVTNCEKGQCIAWRASSEGLCCTCVQAPTGDRNSGPANGRQMIIPLSMTVCQNLSQPSDGLVNLPHCPGVGSVNMALGSCSFSAQMCKDSARGRAASVALG
jgi:hypothetical protein